ncbi:hypothetical protein [Methylocystis parvus]|uniref:Uncharacterized protein n=1 Tax=Methylocystis parvus TaxID=134 RepID=A0A6B8M6K3_9HYPH|nr:hypothetical protein [Methylocystis parvus]QGM98531.1 hypothetical protein F7D14_14300 [Methylocystis parvus]WBK01131.1 hypothetical protein MMG94_05270 [Methylocystis parvus OBBP]
MSLARIGLAAGFLFSVAPVRAEEIVPLAGCYARLYDAAWLKAHPGQIVRRVTLSVTKTAVPRTPGETQPILADATLAMWSGQTSFSTVGACYWERVGLACNAALSAEERRLCKTKEDGVRDCRLSMTDSGSFALTQKPEGLLVTVRERLELLGPMDRASFLYLSPSNAENHAFLLQPVPEANCK